MRARGESPGLCEAARTSAERAEWTAPNLRGLITSFGNNNRGLQPLLTRRHPRLSPIFVTGDRP